MSTFFHIDGWLDYHPYTRSHQSRFLSPNYYTVYIGLGAGVAASAASMVLAPAIAIFVMGGICIANVPYSVLKERNIGKIPSLRAMNNKLREDANNLEDAVDELSGEIDILEPEADR